MSTQTAAAAWVPQPLVPETFADRLRLLRLADGDQSVQAMATKCGVPTPSWRKWEHGAMPHDLPKIVRRIHQATGVDMAWLAFGTALTGPGTPAEEHSASSRCIERTLAEVSHLFSDVEPEALETVAA